MEDDVDEEIKKDKNLKTIVSINPFNKEQHKIIDFMAKISKNIYNCSIFSREIFDFFNKNICTDVVFYCQSFKNWNKKFTIKEKDSKKTKKNKETSRKSKYEEIKQNILKFILNAYKPYRELYCKNLNLYKTYRNQIKHFVMEENKKNPIINSNYENYFLITTEFVKHINENNYEIHKTFITDEIKDTIDWLYTLNFNNTKNELLDHKPIKINNDEFIENVKNEIFVVKFKKSDSLKKQIKDLLGIDIHSKQFIVKKITRDYLMGNDKYLPGDIISNIIDTSYEAYTSYFAKKMKGISCNLPKYLSKNEKYNLFYTASSRKRINEKFMRISLGKYIADNYREITNQPHLICVNNNLYGATYIRKKHMIDKEDMNEDCKYYKVVDDFKHVKYVDKKNKFLIEANYLYLIVPPQIEKIEDSELSLIEISPMYEGYKYKVCYSYKTDPIKINEYDKQNIENYLFADTGVINLFTFYDPLGLKQFILSGGNINEINHSYNNLIDKEKSELSKMKDKDGNKIYTNERIRNLLIKRENEINAYFDEVCNWILKEYGDKKCLVIGNNKNWKNKVNMGRKQNRKFYEIPFKKLFDELKWKLNKKGIDVVLTEESYTSKCDSLALEEVCIHEKYKGNRDKRGLFSSSTKRLLNADMNGAINIGRKYMKRMNVEIKNINEKGIFNPIKIKICLNKKPKKINSKIKIVKNKDVHNKFVMNINEI